MPRLLRFAPFVALACGSQSATISVTTGGESDALTRDPAMTSFVIDAVDRSGGVTQLGTPTPYPTTSGIDLGNPSQSLVASLQLTGKDSAGDAVVFGAAPFAELAAFNGTTVPLFVQRKGELARMPGAIRDARTAPLLATTSRAVYYAGGSSSSVSGPLTVGGYDLLGLNDLGGTCPAAAAKSFALVLLTQANNDGEIAMAWRIDDAAVNVVGLAQCIDYSSLVMLPAGISWSDFAGGSTVMGDDGSAYIVGPSRTNSASGTVLKIQPIANATTLLGVSASVLSISSRQGAATAWAPARGIFVYGGTTPSSSSGEVVNANGGATEIRPPTADTRSGLAAIAFDATKTMLVGGDGTQPLLVDLSCVDCAPTPWGKATNVKMTSPSLFALGNGAFLLVGDDPTGATQVFRLSESDAKPISLKIARTGARAIQTQTGSVVILGGGSSTPESYVD